jgi:Protein of unknown function (DUF3551)
MRALMIVGVIAAAASVGLPAQAQNYPWCAQYGDGTDGGRNCGFTTLQQCQEDVSGIGGFCEQNNTYVPQIAPAPHRASKHHSRKNT